MQPYQNHATSAAHGYLWYNKVNSNIRIAEKARETRSLDAQVIAMTEERHLRNYGLCFMTVTVKSIVKALYHCVPV